MKNPVRIDTTVRKFLAINAYKRLKRVRANL